MPRLPTTSCRLPCVVLALGPVLALLVGGAPAMAQTVVEGLRGLPTQEELAGVARRPNPLEDAPVEEGFRPDYRSLTPNVEPEPELRTRPAESIFEEEADEADIFADPLPPSTYRPSTARIREREARDALALPAVSPAAQSVTDANPTGTTPAFEADIVGEAELEESRRVQRIEALEAGDDGIGERDNIRQEPIEGRGLTPAENPYAPLGIRAGRFILTPSLEQGLTSTSNADQSPTGGSAILSETTLRLGAQSDWSRHSASLDAFGIVRESLSGQSLSEFEAGVDAAVELDLANDFRLRGELGYLRRPEDATSPVVILGTADQPLRQELTGSLALLKDLGKLRLGLTGAVERNVYGDAQLSGGGTLSQADRDSTLATAILRVGYEVSPALVPFVEAEYGQRFYDEALDTAGFDRSADRIAARAGISFDLSEKLNGEISAGYLREAFDDDRLASISGPTISAAINWSPIRGTIVAISGDTRIEGTTTAGDSGSLLYSGRLAVERELLANLTGIAAIGISWRDYTDTGDTETFTSAELGTTWWFNRYAGLTTRIRHEFFRSSLPGRDSETTSIFAGIRLQR